MPSRRWLGFALLLIVLAGVYALELHDHSCAVCRAVHQAATEAPPSVDSEPVFAGSTHVAAADAPAPPTPAGREHFSRPPPA